MSKDQPKEWERDLSIVIVGGLGLFLLKAVWSSKIRPAIDRVMAEVKMPTKGGADVAFGMDQTDVVGLIVLAVIVGAALILVRKRGRKKKKETIEDEEPAGEVSV
jgi:hypothetical protein